ncbi:hypothetical protein [Acidovorax sp. SRB_14]|uniref:hypothetical protein n=1 Tax=Acidovorax sp. SRB_14 TaxID=1962699 RepID=UPI0015655B5F|nr:hypothetical protein [Acidovorax sp. SRB_14]
MRAIFKALILTAASALMACGGGGGSPGLVGNPGAGGGGTAPSAKMQLQIYAGSSGNSAQVYTISASEKTARAKVTLKDASGAPLANTIILFSESGGGLLSFSPESKTALTNSLGEAEVDIEALSINSFGATTVNANADVQKSDGTVATVTASQNLAITSVPVAGVDPQVAATSLNFVSVDPSDKSIVIAGSGGNGRSESAILRFRAVDKNGNPVKDVVVDFSVVPSNSVALNIVSAKSNNDGIVATSVSSKSTPTAVIIKAGVNGRPVTTQSDQLTVTTGVAMQRGFDLSASKYNLNNDISGDSSNIRVAIVDASGNPVSDGVPVIAVTDFGRVGTSGRGGCTTVNGICTVEYQVQNPRPQNGHPVIVTFSTQVGSGELISDSIVFTSTSVSQLDLYSTNTPVSSITVPAGDAKCKATVDLLVGTASTAGGPSGFPAPAGTMVEVKPSSSIVTASVISGSPTADRATGRTTIQVQFDLKDAASPGSTSVDVVFTADKMVQTLRKTLTYPACTPV